MAFPIFLKFHPFPERGCRCSFASASYREWTVYLRWEQQIRQPPRSRPARTDKDEKEEKQGVILRKSWQRWEEVVMLCQHTFTRLKSQLLVGSTRILQQSFFVSLIQQIFRVPINGTSTSQGAPCTGVSTLAPYSDLSPCLLLHVPSPPIQTNHRSMVSVELASAACQQGKDLGWPIPRHRQNN